MDSPAAILVRSLSTVFPVPEKVLTVTQLSEGCWEGCVPCAPLPMSRISHAPECMPVLMCGNSKNCRIQKPLVSGVHKVPGSSMALTSPFLFAL